MAQSLKITIPDPSIRRLSAYLRELERLSGVGVERVSSRQLAENIKGGDAQVRRDLALFGQFGRRGVGYYVDDLIGRLRNIMGTDSPWKVIVVGAGELSHALLRYPGFPQHGFELVAAFDNDRRKIGTHVGSVTVRHIDELESTVAECKARLAILAIPADAAQEITNRLGKAGIEGIMNFAPTSLEAPPNVHINQVDLTAHLEQLSFQVSHTRPK